MYWSLLKCFFFDSEIRDCEIFMLMVFVAFLHQSEQKQAACSQSSLRFEKNTTAFTETSSEWLYGSFFHYPMLKQQAHCVIFIPLKHLFALKIFFLANILFVIEMILSCSNCFDPTFSC